MLYGEGKTLRQVTGDGPLSLASLLSISLQVEDKLAAAHAQEHHPPRHQIEQHHHAAWAGQSVGLQAGQTAGERGGSGV